MRSSTKVPNTHPRITVYDIQWHTNVYI